MENKSIDPVSYCVMIFWMHGLKISQIHKNFAGRHGKTEHAVRGIINRIGNRRAAMKRSDRQQFLDKMKEARVDDGMLPDSYFIAKPLPTDGKVFIPRKKKVIVDPYADLDLTKRADRKEKKKREEEKKRMVEAEAIRRERGLAPRGIEAAPLEYLFERGLLHEPKEASSLKSGPSNATRRMEAGERFRRILMSAYSSGMKTQNLESSGGGSGAGVVIHAVVAENLANIDEIKKVIGTDDFRQIDTMLRLDSFIWQTPSKEAEKLVLSDIRRILDAVSVFLNLMSAVEFALRWGYSPRATKKANRDEVREANHNARDMIYRAQKEVR